MSLEEPDERAFPDGGDGSSGKKADGVQRLDPDLDLDIPVLKVEELQLEVQDLTARISVQAELADFFKINVGVDAHLDAAKLGIKGVEAQARLKVRLEGILNAVERVLDTIDRNPEVLGATGRAPEKKEDQPDAPAKLESGALTDPESARTPEDDVAEDWRTQATAAARERAEQLGLRLSGVQGTGAGGRILVRDVEAAKD